MSLESLEGSLEFPHDEEQSSFRIRVEIGSGLYAARMAFDRGENLRANVEAMRNYVVNNVLDFVDIDRSRGHETLFMKVSKLLDARGSEVRALLRADEDDRIFDLVIVFSWAMAGLIKLKTSPAIIRTETVAYLHGIGIDKDLEVLVANFVEMAR